MTVLACMLKINISLIVQSLMPCSEQSQFSLDPDQDRQNVGPDLDPNSLTL